MSDSVQVFEHQRLSVGERCRTTRGKDIVFSSAHFEALTRYADRHRPPPFEIRHRAVLFRQYVGVIQAGALTLEILPKVDREAHGINIKEESLLWRNVLVQLLNLCPQLGVREVQHAELGTEPTDLLDLYVTRFLCEVARLMREGLARRYHTEESNRTAFCGRLLVAENIRQNLAHRERVYVATHELSTDRLENRILHYALRVLTDLRLQNPLGERARRLLLDFPLVQQLPVTLEDFARIVSGRHTDRYADALALARLILMHYSPAPRSGGEDTLALLIDMNRLFQNFVLAILRRVAPAGWHIDGRASADFWPAEEARPKRLLPDIVITHDGKPAIVLDTKWKMPDTRAPTDADLRQVFAYGEFFGVPRAALLYPAGNYPATARGGHFLHRNLRCDFHYVNLFPVGRTQGRLNLEQVGKRLWRQLGIDPQVVRDSCETKL